MTGAALIIMRAQAVPSSARAQSLLTTKDASKAALK